MAEDLQIDIIDFKGRRITCTKSQWQHHIVECPHHEYMEDEEDSVITALIDPQFGLRFIDEEFKNRRSYYKLSESKDYYTKVTVEFDNEDGEGDGRIITAYMPDSIKPNEKPEF